MSYTISNSDGNLVIELAKVGAQGQQGPEGLHIVSATMNQTANLILTMSDGSAIDAGQVEQFNLGDFNLVLDTAGTGLNFVYNNNVVMKLSSTGDIHIAGDMNTNASSGDLTS